MPALSSLIEQLINMSRWVGQNMQTYNTSLCKNISHNIPLPLNMTETAVITFSRSHEQLVVRIPDPFH